MLFHSALESGVRSISDEFSGRFEPSIVQYGVTRVFVSNNCWIIANNFGLHITITTIDCTFEHVGELEEERAVAGANNANRCSSCPR